MPITWAPGAKEKYSDPSFKPHSSGSPTMNFLKGGSSEEYVPSPPKYEDAHGEKYLTSTAFSGTVPEGESPFYDFSREYDDDYEEEQTRCNGDCQECDACHDDVATVAGQWGETFEIAMADMEYRSKLENAMASRLVFFGKTPALQWNDELDSWQLEQIDLMRKNFDYALKTYPTSDLVERLVNIVCTSYVADENIREGWTPIAVPVASNDSTLS